MKSPKCLLLFLFIAILATALSCKKKNNGSTGSNRLALIDLSHSGSVQHYRIVYDEYNNVDSMVIIGGGTDTGFTGFQAFSYFGSSYSVTDANGNSFTVDANTSGVILEVLTTDTLFMTYNGAELGELDTKAAGGTKVATNYTWSNGDIVSTLSQGVTDSCDYNLSKNGQIGDAFRIDAFLSYGRPYIETAHLLTDIKSGGVWQEKYFYQFDGQGRISQFVKVKNNNGVSADDTTFYNYQYYAD